MRLRRYQSVTISVFPLCPGGLLCLRSLPKCRHLSCSPICPDGLLRRRSDQSVAIYRVPPCAEVGFCAFEVIKVSPFIVFPTLPRALAHSKLPKCRHLSCSPLCPGLLRIQSYQSVAIYCVPPYVPDISNPLAPSKLPKCRHCDVPPSAYVGC